MATNSYSAKDIEVLEGLEPVRKRPAMYIGGTDSRTATTTSSGRSSTTRSTRPSTATPSTSTSSLDADRKGVSVQDDGRGIPVDMHPKFKKPALEIILCTLHAGGKFNSGSYKVSGGLHGVGSSVVNALSDAARRHGVEQRCSTPSSRSPVALASDAAQEGRRRSASAGRMVHFRPDPRRSSARRARASTPEIVQASGSRPRPTCTVGSSMRFVDNGGQGRRDSYRPPAG